MTPADPAARSAPPVGSRRRRPRPARAPAARARSSSGSTPPASRTAGVAGAAGAPPRAAVPRAQRARRRSAVATGALVVLGAFEAPAPGWPPGGGARSRSSPRSAGPCARRAVRAAAGEPRQPAASSSRSARSSSSPRTRSRRRPAAGDAESPFQPVVYLVMAFLVAFLARGVGLRPRRRSRSRSRRSCWAARGARAVGRSRPAVVHAGFVDALRGALPRGPRGADGRRRGGPRPPRSSGGCARSPSGRGSSACSRPGAAGEADAAERERRWTRGGGRRGGGGGARRARDRRGRAAQPHLRGVPALRRRPRAPAARVPLRERGGDARAASRPARARSAARCAGARRCGSTATCKAVSYYRDGTRAAGAPRGPARRPARRARARRASWPTGSSAAPFDDEDERLLVHALGGDPARGRRRAAHDRHEARPRREGALLRRHRAAQPDDEAARGVRRDARGGARRWCRWTSAR